MGETNIGGPADFESDRHLGRAKHVRRLSLKQLEDLALELERLGADASKSGVVVVKRRPLAGRETPRLVVMTESVWRRMSGSVETESEAVTQNNIGTADPAQAPVAHPTPATVGETVDSLRQAGVTVSVRLLVRELRRRTGCSRAGAYRAVADAFAANAIRRT